MIYFMYKRHQASDKNIHFYIKGIIKVIYWILHVQNKMVSSTFNESGLDSLQGEHEIYLLKSCG